MRPWSMRFSRPVACTSTPDSCATQPIARRTAAGSRTTSWPATVATPAVGAESVVSILTTVDLPAPFGPSRPKTEPAGIWRLMPRTASTPPLYVLTSSFASTARFCAAGMATLPGHEKLFRRQTRYSSTSESQDISRLRGEGGPQVGCRRRALTGDAGVGGRRLRDADTAGGWREVAGDAGVKGKGGGKAGAWTKGGR